MPTVPRAPKQTPAVVVELSQYLKCVLYGKKPAPSALFMRQGNAAGHLNDLELGKLVEAVTNYKEGKRAEEA